MPETVVVVLDVVVVVGTVVVVVAATVVDVVDVEVVEVEDVDVVVAQSSNATSRLSPLVVCTMYPFPGVRVSRFWGRYEGFIGSNVPRAVL